MSRSRNLCLNGLIVPIWAAVLGTGLFWLYQYENTPSLIAAAPEQWPEVAGLVRNAATPTLLVFLHPHCPCSHATVSELEKLTARTSGTLPTCVVFLHPDEVTSDWHQTSLWRRACAVPGVTVLDDVGSKATRQFGVTTSGQALLYDAAGQLQFNGGMTAARGHAGDNAGCEIIVSYLREDSLRSTASGETCSVFGCPMFQSSETSAALHKELR